MAQIDNREAILARLEAIFATIVPEANVFRNDIDVPESNLPAMVLLDADEIARDESYGRNRPANGPIIMDMEPEIYYLAETTEAIGTKLNLKRRAIIKAILHDETLLGLSYEGDIRYLGIGTGLAAGRSMLGEISFSFSIAYVLRPSRL